MWQEAGGAIGLSCPRLALSRPSRRAEQGHGGVYSRAPRGRLAVRSRRPISRLSGRPVQSRGRRPATRAFKRRAWRTLSGVQSFHLVAGRCWVVSLRGVDLQEDTGARPHWGFFLSDLCRLFSRRLCEGRVFRGGVKKNVAFTARTVKGGRVKLILTEGHISVIVALEVVRLN